MKLIVPATEEQFHRKKPGLAFSRSVTSPNIFGETESLWNIKKPPYGGSLA